jgi:hypothetical protein
MITSFQRKDFVQALLPDPQDFLGEALAWIRAYLEPEDVFDDSKLGG